MMPVAKQMSDFINNPQSFMDYQRPPQVIDLEKDTDGSIKKEMIKTLALAQVIYEDDLAEKREIPFKHHGVDDVQMLIDEEKAL